MSKLTIHFQRIPSWFEQFVDRCQGRLEYIVGVDVFPDLADVQVLGRTYLPDGESDAMVNRGAPGADEWIDRFAQVYADHPQVDKWIGPNEYVLWDQNAVDRFNAFHVRFIERMSALGHGVVCGHIQHAKIRDIQGIRYHNCGDWVESNTALVERFDGHIELLHWSDHAARYAADGDVAAAMHQAG